MTTSSHWADQAACLGADDALFFPERRTGAANHGREAKRICASCSVVVECLLDALEARLTHGIWGGAGETERRALGRLYHRRGADPSAWAEALDRHVSILGGSEAAALVANRNGLNATCGLAASYNRGCRCAACSCAKAMDGRRRAKVRRVVAA